MKFKQGDDVIVDIYDAGPATPYPPVGTVHGIILVASQHECDVLIHPEEDNLLEANELLERVGFADGISEIQEGPVYVLRSMNVEWLHKETR